MKINNENLSDFIAFKLDKFDDDFGVEELGTIEEMVFDPINIIGEFEPIDLRILEYFTGMKKVSFRNMSLDKQSLEMLKRLPFLESVDFSNCKIEDLEQLRGLNVSQLYISINDNITSDIFKEMTSLNRLALVSVKNVDVLDLVNLKNLSALYFSKSPIENFKSISILPKLNVLYMDNTNISDISPVLELDKLKVLSLDEEQYNGNHDTILKLIKNEVILYNEGVTYFKTMVDEN